MDDFFRALNVFNDLVLWDVAVWRVIAALALVFVGFASRRAIERAFRFVGRKASATRVQWDDEAARLLDKPLALVAQLLLWRVAASVLLLPSTPVDTRAMVAQGLYAAFLVALIWVAFRVVDVLASVADRFAAGTHTRIDDQAIPLLRKTLKVFLALLGGIFIVQNLGYSVTSLVAGLGIGGLALALAAQDSVANFFGSVILFTDAPFQVGDYVEVGSVIGTVEEVGFRTTRIRQDDTSLASVPNQTFTSAFITNHSARKGRMVSLSFGLAPTGDPAALESFLTQARAAFAEHPEIDPETVQIHLAGLGTWSIEVSVRAFTMTSELGLFLATREALVLRLLRLLDQCGLTLGHGARTLFVRDGHPDLLGVTDGVADTLAPPSGEA